MSFKKGVAIVLAVLMLVFLVNTLAMARPRPGLNEHPWDELLLRPDNGRMNAHPWEEMLRPLPDGRMNGHPWEDLNLLRAVDDEHPWQH